MKQNTYTLLCEKDMGMALITIPKLRSFIDNHSSLIIVDDGTLSEKSIEKLKNIAENIIVVTRKERDEIILNKISKYPNICELRNKFAFAFKLIDIPILSLENFEGRYTYTDTDIRNNFFRNVLHIIMEPAGWFLLWTGLDHIFYDSRTKEKDYIFNLKMANSEIVFMSL